MAYEDIEIRIGRDGKIYVKLDGCTEERISNYREFLEENIGPVLDMQAVQKPDWDHPVALSAEKEKEAEKKRMQELHGD